MDEEAEEVPNEDCNRDKAEEKCGQSSLNSCLQDHSKSSGVIFADFFLQKLLLFQFCTNLNMQYFCFEFDFAT